MRVSGVKSRQSHDTNERERHYYGSESRWLCTKRSLFVSQARDRISVKQNMVAFLVSSAPAPCCDSSDQILRAVGRGVGEGSNVNPQSFPSVCAERWSGLYRRVPSVDAEAT